MNNLVLVTSAIHTNYGIYSTEDRIAQTIKSLNSIKQYIPNPKIVFIDNGKIVEPEIKQNDFKEILKLIDVYIDNSNEGQIKYFHENVENYDVGKNCMESLGMKYALTHLYYNDSLFEQIQACNRIFKISGRYEISEKFNMKVFSNASTKNKFVFKKCNDSWINPEWTGVNKQLQTRLWSFTPSLYFETMAIFDRIIQNMFIMVNSKMYIDLEHSMYKFIPKNKLIQVDVVGVKGNIAPNGAYVIE